MNVTLQFTLLFFNVRGMEVTHTNPFLQQKNEKGNAKHKKDTFTDHRRKEAESKRETTGGF